MFFNYYTKAHEMWIKNVKVITKTFLTIPYVP